MPIRAAPSRNCTLATVPKERADVYDMLCEADAIGVFQVESRAQMNMLPRLRPRRILRPGGGSGDRAARPDPGRHGASLSQAPQSSSAKIRTRCSIIPSPARHIRRTNCEEVLDKTLGVPLFQEQAMKLAIVAAKFTADEANGLRRAMATFRHVGTIGTFERQIHRPHDRRAAMTRTSPKPASSRSRASALTAFPKAMPPALRCWSMSRPGSRSIIPAAFAAALLNSQPMGFYAPAEIVRCARENGKVTVLAPDAAFSDWDCTLERNAKGELCLRLGFRQIDGFKRRRRPHHHGRTRLWLSRLCRFRPPHRACPSARW